MKITVNKKEELNVEAGDFLVIWDSEQEREIRQIIEYRGNYIAVDLEAGDVGFIRETVEELVCSYKKVFDSVVVVKNSEVEIVIGGR